MSLQENIEKKIFVPPLNHSGGGDIFAVPPWIAQAEDNSQGVGQSPPEIAQGGGRDPIPPLVSALANRPIFLESGIVFTIRASYGMVRWDSEVQVFLPKIWNSKFEGIHIFFILF